jgi:hypothetical protein
MALLIAMFMIPVVVVFNASTESVSPAPHTRADPELLCLAGCACSAACIYQRSQQCLGSPAVLSDVPCGQAGSKTDSMRRQETEENVSPPLPLAWRYTCPTPAPCLCSQMNAHSFVKCAVLRCDPKPHVTSDLLADGREARLSPTRWRSALLL